MLKTCGWCRHFKEHKSGRRFAGGWWLGDGKCKYKKATVIGDTCNKWEVKYAKKNSRSKVENYSTNHL